MMNSNLNEQLDNNLLTDILTIIEKSGFDFELKERQRKFDYYMAKSDDRIKDLSKLNKILSADGYEVRLTQHRSRTSELSVKIDDRFDLVFAFKPINVSSTMNSTYLEVLPLMMLAYSDTELDWPTLLSKLIVNGKIDDKFLFICDQTETMSNGFLNFVNTLTEDNKDILHKWKEIINIFNLYKSLSYDVNYLKWLGYKHDRTSNIVDKTDVQLSQSIRISLKSIDVDHNIFLHNTTLKKMLSNFDYYDIRNETTKTLYNRFISNLTVDEIRKFLQIIIGNFVNNTKNISNGYNYIVASDYEKARIINIDTEDIGVWYNIAKHKIEPISITNNKNISELRYGNDISKIDFQLKDLPIVNGIIKYTPLKIKLLLSAK